MQYINMLNAFSFSEPEFLTELYSCFPYKVGSKIYAQAKCPPPFNGYGDLMVSGGQKNCKTVGN